MRIFELKSKYRRLAVKDKSEQKIVRQLSSCLIEIYSGFTQISIEYQKKQRKLFKPIDIIYKPTKRIEIEPLCFFSDDMSKAYSSLCSSGEKMHRAHKCYQCYYCNKFFIREHRQKIHCKTCKGILGVIYNFNNQNLISYQDNFNTKGDVPFVLYFDFETTAPTFNFSEPQQQKMFVVSYVMIVIFHPKLNLDRIIIQRSFAHSLEQLTTLDYFTRQKILYVDSSIIKMLEDMAFEDAKRKCENSVGKFFRLKVH